MTAVAAVGRVNIRSWPMFKSSASAKPRRAIALCAAFAVLLVALGAYAQSDDERAGARAAAQEGASAFREKRWSDAIDLFTRAESLVHSPMHVIFMARAHANLNKLVKARELYNKVIREPLPTNAPKAFQNAQDEAQKELNELEPRLPYVTVQVEGAGAQTVSVTQNGVAIPPALIGVPRPVDPGEHEFQALTESLASRPQKVTVAEKSRQNVALKLEPRTAVSAPPVTPPPTGATPETPGAGTSAQPGTPGAVADVPPASDSGSSKQGLRIGSYVAFGVGVAGLAVGTVFLLKAGSKADEADDLCASKPAPGGKCDISLQSGVKALEDEEKSARTLSTVGFIAGGVGVAAGVTLFILSSGGSEQASRTRRPRVEPLIGLGSVGLRGTF
jgi:hypothetical protein